MAVSQDLIIEQLKDVGNRLLKHPSSTNELLSILTESELLLSTIGQAPSQPVKEALILPMKALIADELLRNPDPDVKITVASCLNQVMRISAPVTPYDDDKMKEIFELIVMSFDNLSYPPGRLYSKADLILKHVAKLQSCVMMLDLDCDPLITKMFELFLKTISPEHHESVFPAMEKIMIVMIKESDAVSVDLLKVLLASIRKETQNVSPTSWKLGAKVIEECAEKFKPNILRTVKSMGSCLEDYDPILSSICKDEPDALKSVDDDCAKDVAHSKSSAEKSHTVEYVQSLTAVEPGNQSAAARTKSGSIVSKKGMKPNSGKGKTSLASPHARTKQGPAASKGEDEMHTLEDVPTKGEKKEVADLEHKQPGDRSKTKGRLQKKGIPAGSGSKSATGSSRKDKSRMNDASRSQKKHALSDDDDDVIETPHGRKNYKEDLVGSRVKVWWPLDRKYYEGTISSFDASTKKHKVNYDDGDEEILNLREERWEFLGEETPDDLELLADKQALQPSSDVKKRALSTEAEREASLDSGGSLKDTKIVEKSITAEVKNETKKPKLSDGQKS